VVFQALFPILYRGAIERVQFAMSDIFWPSTIRPIVVFGSSYVFLSKICWRNNSCCQPSYSRLWKEQMVQTV